MLYNLISNKFPFVKRQPEDVIIVLIYRYLSLAITTFFFIAGRGSNSLLNSILVISCITASCIISSYLYLKVRGNYTHIEILVFIETIGNSFLLILSGGMDSPYVWYSLNTILIASMELSRKLCWLNLGLYLLVSVGSSYILGVDAHIDVINKITRDSNLILSLVLITLAIQLLANYVKKIQRHSIKLKEANDRIMAANKTIKESMDYIMELYQAVHLFSTRDGKEDMIQLIVQYTRKITKALNVFFISENDGVENNIYGADAENSLLENRLEQRFKELKGADYSSRIPLFFKLEGKNYVAALVRSNYKNYGILVVESPSDEDNPAGDDIKYQVKFLADLGSIVLEGLELEKVNKKLLISEEQNRIANEIHDSVLQKLFSISCGIFGLMKNPALRNEAKKELELIRNNINETLKDLRAAVYGLSWRKGGVNSFIDDIIRYIDETKRLNQIEINFDLKGDCEILTTAHKKSIYRIVCEGIGNAIRHGRASVIDVSLEIGDGAVQLNINDNGVGFSLDELKRSNKFGLGLENISNLVHMLKGRIDFNSIIGKGTGISIFIPVFITDLYKEEVV